MGLFNNLTHLDVSDNSVLIGQLVNLHNLMDLDIQYNNLTFINLPVGCFPKLETLRLSYNKIPPSHLTHLGSLNRLKVLEIASNDLCTLPSSLAFFHSLTDLNLSANNLSSDSVLVNPNQLFVSLSTIPNLTRLNLARNKLSQFHCEGLP